MSIHDQGCFLGVLPDGTVNVVAVLDADAAIESLRAGMILVPCKPEQARVLWGKQIANVFTLETK